jgi:hypothetical protein
MALPAEFSLLHSELNDFLYAQMGEEEESGAPLSVLSALTRLGADPWAEGARLSGLPRDAAARALVPMIAMFPKEKRGSLEVLALAERVAGLLPQRPGQVMGGLATGDHGRARTPGLWITWVGLILVVIGLRAFGLLPDH